MRVHFVKVDGVPGKFRFHDVGARVGCGIAFLLSPAFTGDGVVDVQSRRHRAGHFQNVGGPVILYRLVLKSNLGEVVIRLSYGDLCGHFFHFIGVFPQNGCRLIFAGGAEAIGRRIGHGCSLRHVFDFYCKKFAVVDDVKVVELRARKDVSADVDFDRRSRPQIRHVNIVFPFHKELETVFRRDHIFG